MIYRWNSSDTYRLLQESVIALNVSANQSGFQCLDENIPQSVEIQENDVVGACLMDIDDVIPLRLVSTCNGNRLYRNTNSDSRICGAQQIGSVTTNEFERKRSLILHVSANIGNIEAL